MWQLRDGAHPVLTDEGGAILSERTGRWSYLTPTASVAVMLLLAGSTPEQAADRFATRYGIPAEQAAIDVRNVAETLTVQGLAHDEPTLAPATRSRRRWRWTR
ncbi:PqqD family protein [Streptomyces sp. NPDC091377]|uniref:PqqD family protein n=1 Tax=Streptomyces sp. NPDC091377 TaxID=3365995 RepID=UPI0037F6C4FA